MPQPAWNRRVAAQLALLLLVGLGVLALERYFLRLRVAEVTPEVFSRVAIALRQTEKWNYGYTPGDHGATLVRSPRFELERAEEPWSPPGITAVMERDLRLLPWRIAGEILLYLAVAAIVVVGGPWLARRRGWRRAPAWGAAAALSFGLLISPHLMTGYGTALYSNWWGPGPMSYTTSPAGNSRPTLLPGDTISYRPVLERALYPGLRLFVRLLEPVEGSRAVVALFNLPYVHASVFWGSQVAFCFLAALAVATLCSWASRLATRLRG